MIQTAPSGYIGSVSPSSTSVQGATPLIDTGVSVQTQQDSSQTETTALQSLNKQITSTQRAIKNFVKQGQPERADYLVEHLKDLQSAKSDLISKGLAYERGSVSLYTPKTTQSPESFSTPVMTSPLKTVESPITASELMASKLGTPSQDIISKGLQSPTFYAPRTISPQETTNISSPINIKSEPVKVYSGSIEARKPSDFSTTPLKGVSGIEQIEFKYLTSPVSKIQSSILSTGLTLGGSAIIGGAKRVTEMVYNPIEIPKTIGTGLVLSATGGLGLALVGGYAVSDIASSKSISEASQKVGSGVVDFGVMSKGVKLIPKDFATRLGDTNTLSTKALEYTPKAESINVIEPEYSVKYAEPFVSKASKPTSSNYPVFVREVKPEFKYDSGTKVGDFKLDTTNYIQTGLLVGDVTLGKRVFQPVTTLTGETSYVPKKGFLAERGVKLDFTPIENPFLYYGQQRLKVASEPLKFVDVMEAPSKDISPYVKGEVTNIPVSGVLGKNFVMYKEYSKYFPIKQGVLNIEGVEQTGEGISRYVFRPELKSSPNKIPFFEQSDIIKGEGFGFKPSRNIEVIKRPETQIGLGSFFGGVPESQALVVKSSKGIKSIYSQPNINALDFKKGVSEIYNTEASRQVLRQEIGYEGTKPIDTIALGKISPNVKPKIEIPVESKYGSKYEGASVKFNPEEVGVKPSAEVSSKVFGKKYEYVKATPDFGTQNVQVKSAKAIAPSYGLNVVSSNIISPTTSYIGSSNLASTSEVSSKIESGVKSDVSSITGLKLTSTQSQALKSISRSVQESTPESTSEVSSKPISPSIPTPSIPKIKSPESFNLTYRKKKESKKSSVFTPEVRKKGKFVKLASTESSVLAFARAIENIRSSASASGRVTESGRAIKPITVPSDFGISKKDLNVFVQKREKRISSAGEKLEISRKGQMARRRLL